MEGKNRQYFSYEEQHNKAEFKIVEEDKLLTQLQEDVSSSKGNHSDDELNAAVGMMLMHYQAMTVPEIASTNNCDTENKEPMQNPLKPILPIPKEYPTQSVHIETMFRPIRPNRNYNSKSPLITSCRNLLKEFLSQKGY